MASKRKLTKLFSLLLLHARRSTKPVIPPSRPPAMQRDGCPPPPPDDTRRPSTLVVDVDTALLLRGRAGEKEDPLELYFPYFMLVAVEAGGFLRGLLLLLAYPLLRLLARLGPGAAAAVTKPMAFMAFCGLRAARFRAGRAVLPKWLMEAVAEEALAAARGRRLVCVARGMPRVMLDGFLREYLGADVVVGTEMHAVCGFYTGLMLHDDHRHDMVDADATAVGFSGSPDFLDHPLARCCKVRI